VCFAQAWHWFDPSHAASEVARVLAPGSRWAAWWSHAHADGEVWFDAYQDLMEKTCPVYRRRDRDTGNHAWSVEPVAATELFGEGRKVVVQWTRHVSCEQWLVEERSKSYVEALEPTRRAGLLDRVSAIINSHFPHQDMAVPYRTHMWTAQPLWRAPSLWRALRFWRSPACLGHICRYVSLSGPSTVGADPVRMSSRAFT
jgi:hypothetical protein